MNKAQLTIKRQQELKKQVDSLLDAILDHKAYLFTNWIRYKSDYCRFDDYIITDRKLNELYYRADVLIRNPLWEK